MAYHKEVKVVFCMILLGWPGKNFLPSIYGFWTTLSTLNVKGDGHELLHHESLYRTQWRYHLIVGSCGAGRLVADWLWFRFLMPLIFFSQIGPGPIKIFIVDLLSA